MADRRVQLVVEVGFGKGERVEVILYWGWSLTFEICCSLVKQLFEFSIFMTIISVLTKIL